MILMRSCSIFFGSSCLVRSRRRESRMTCVSTTTPLAMPKPEPRTTLPVLRATPGSVRISSIVCGTSPWKFSMMPLLAPMIDFVLLRKNPVGRISCSSSLRIGVGEIFWRFVFLVERFCDFVDADVGALRRQNRRDQQLERVFVFQFAVRFGVGFVEFLKNCGDALWSRFRRRLFFATFASTFRLLRGRADDSLRRLGRLALLRSFAFR